MGAPWIALTYSSREFSFGGKPASSGNLCSDWLYTLILSLRSSPFLPFTNGEAAPNPTRNGRVVLRKLKVSNASFSSIPPTLIWSDATLGAFFAMCGPSLSMSI